MGYMLFLSQVRQNTCSGEHYIDLEGTVPTAITSFIHIFFGRSVRWATCYFWARFGRGPSEHVFQRALHWLTRYCTYGYHRFHSYILWKICQRACMLFLSQVRQNMCSREHYIDLEYTVLRNITVFIHILYSRPVRGPTCYFWARFGWSEHMESTTVIENILYLGVRGSRRFPAACCDCDGHVAPWWRRWKSRWRRVVVCSCLPWSPATWVRALSRVTCYHWHVVTVEGGVHALTHTHTLTSQHGRGIPAAERLTLNATERCHFFDVVLLEGGRGQKTRTTGKRLVDRLSQHTYGNKGRIEDAFFFYYFFVSSVTGA